MVEPSVSLPHLPRPQSTSSSARVEAKFVPGKNLLEQSPSYIWEQLTDHVNPEAHLYQALEGQVKQVAGKSMAYAWGFTTDEYRDRIRIAGAERPFLDAMGGKASLASACEKLGIRRLFNVDSAYPENVPRNPRLVAEEFPLAGGGKGGMVCSRILSALSFVRTGSMNVCVNGVEVGGATQLQKDFGEALCREIARIVPTNGLLIGQPPGARELHSMMPHHFRPLRDSSDMCVMERTDLPFDQPNPRSQTDAFEPKRA